jgi:hypothetical protein
MNFKCVWSESLPRDQSISFSLLDNPTLYKLQYVILTHEHQQKLTIFEYVKAMLQSPTGPTSWMKISPIEILVTRACEPTLHEPNYALHLEVAEFINQKKANKLSFILFWLGFLSCLLVFFFAF